MEMLNLAGEWKLRAEFMDVGPERFTEVVEKPDGPFTVYTKGPNAFPQKTGFLHTQVPCDVITPLVENGVIEEPFLKTNTKNCLWIRDFSWWFIKDFEVTEAMLQEDVVRLYIEMLDFKADIIINARPVARHTNVFCPFYEDVKRFLKVGANTLVIRLTSGIEDNYPKDAISLYCASDNAICDQRIYLRKPQFTYGWDWCQPVPTCGIGRAIYLEALSGAKIASSRMDTHSVGNDAEVEFFFEIDKTNMTASAEVTLEYELVYDGKTVFSSKKEHLLVGGLNYIQEKATIKEAKLWWPNGYGEQNLYELRARCVCEEKTVEARTKKVGIRTVEIDHSKLPDGTRNFFFKINGVRVFCKGGNWVPTDSVYLRTPDSTYRTLVDEAKAAGFTMLRMWGGGTYEPDCFYEYCSENGILLMHDFMYACGFYPDTLDSFLYEARREADFQTKRLAHYPCMAVWTGNNEIAESFTDWFPEPIAPDRFYGEKIFNYIQPNAVHNNSPQIPYMPSSPYFGNPRANQVDDGDVHAWTYLGRDPKTKFKFSYELEAFDRMPARFSSEYGFFGAQMESTVRRFHDGEEVEYGGEIWKHHGEFDRKRNALDGAINRHLTDFSKLDMAGYLLYSGIMQGSLYSEMAEAMRQKPYGAGDLIWMYNDCWPETGWTVIDYYLTRKISFYFLKRAFDTKKLIVRRKDGGAVVTVINETPEELTAEISYGYRSFAGQASCTGKKAMTIPAHSWQQFEFVAEGDLKNGYFFATGAKDGFETADSLRAYYRDYTFPKASVKIESAEMDGKDMVVTVSADAYVPVAYLKTSDDRVHYSDNYFKLYPGEKKTVRILNCTEAPTVHVAEMEPGERTTTEEFQEASF